jgi:hypothetical protein
MIDSFQREVFTCVENMNHFAEEISAFVEKIEGCANKMAINKLIVDVLMQCKIYHFDSTGECNYKGNTYNNFGKRGVNLLLILAHLIVSGRDIEREYITFQRTVSKRINKLGAFPNNLTKNTVQGILEKKINFLFDVSFDDSVKQAV